MKDILYLAKLMIIMGLRNLVKIKVSQHEKNNLLNELVCTKSNITIILYDITDQFINLFLVAKLSKKTKTRSLTKDNQVSKSQSEAKKTKIIDLTKDNIDFDMEERRLLLKERQLEIEERELKIERERLELQKLRHEFNTSTQ